jgi:DNA polymerase III delta prime subunit
MAVNPHSNKKKYFERLVKNGMLAHAYLFSGPEGIGKKEFALELFRLVNGREAAGDPDLKLIAPRIEEDETKIYIEDIRDLKTFLSFKAYTGPYKFVVINDADRLTPEASNSILKVLEEPTPNSVLILISSKPRALLPTVLSRCEGVQFLRSGEKELDRETIKEINEFIKVAKLGIKDRLKYAEMLHKKGDYQKLVAGLIYWLHARENKNARVLKALLHLNRIVSQPQYNHRLAIENFLINL